MAGNKDSISAKVFEEGGGEVWRGGGGNFLQKAVSYTHLPIKNEADNGLANERGTIAMARTRDPHSATAQFFINTVDNGFLNFSRQSRSSRMSGTNLQDTGKKVVSGFRVQPVQRRETESIS